jgi:hypothetical protein
MRSRKGLTFDKPIVIDDDDDDVVIIENPKKQKATKTKATKKKATKKKATPKSPKSPKPTSPSPRLALSSSLSIQDVFAHLEYQDIVFRVNGAMVGLFEYHRMSSRGRRPILGSLTCKSKRYHGVDTERFYGDENLGLCIEISLMRDAVYLEDYFYTMNNYSKRATRYACEMKPATTEAHRRILDTLLDFIAFATEKHEVYLEDGATKKFGVCDPIYTITFLVAGFDSFYERMGGFKNPVATAAAAAAARTPYAADMTLGEKAASIIKECKAGNAVPEMRASILLIESRFKQEYRNRGGSFPFIYSKPVARPFAYRLAHAYDMDADALVNPTTPTDKDSIDRYLEIDIQT